MTPKKFAFIDALRGIAFLGVLACHVGQKGTGLNSQALALLENSDKGVQLFFMMSALTLFLSLDSRKEETSHPERSFFLRRFFRIAPLFYLGILVYAVLAPLMRHNLSTAQAPAMVATLAFMHGWSPYWINLVVPGGWSIAVEMNFYLLVPWLYRKLPTLGRALGFAVLTCVLAVAVHYLGEPLLEVRSREPILRAAFLRWWLPNQLPAFAFGIVLYQVLRGRLGAGREPDFTRAVLGTTTAVCLFVGLTLSGINPRSILEIPLFGGVLFLFAYSLALYPLRAFVNPLLCYIGKVSFSCYLVHFAVLWTVNRILPSPGRPELRFIALSVLALAGTVAVATLTYRLVEVPGQALGRRLIAGLERQRSKARDSLAFGTLGRGV